MSGDTSLSKLRGAARSRNLGSGEAVAVLGSSVAVVVLGVRGAETLPCRVTPCLPVAPPFGINQLFAIDEQVVTTRPQAWSRRCNCRGLSSTVSSVDINVSVCWVELN